MKTVAVKSGSQFTGNHWVVILVILMGFSIPGVAGGDPNQPKANPSPRISRGEGCYSNMIFTIPVTRADLEKNPEWVLFMELPTVVPLGDIEDPNTPAQFRFQPMFFPRETGFMARAFQNAPQGVFPGQWGESFG